MKKFISVLPALFFGFSLMAQEDTVQFEGETHFKNVQQLTFGGDNAEAYWSFDSFFNLVYSTISWCYIFASGAFAY